MIWMAVLGDLNCDCIYISQKEHDKLKLLTDEGYKWAIEQGVDTTAKDSTNCTYDRIIYSGTYTLRPISLTVMQK